MSVRDIMMAASGATAGPTYIEDVFSTYLYTGNGSTQTINNGIDLAGKGGMVWTKCRSAAEANWLWDTNRGIGANWISPNFGSGYNFPGYGVTSFNSNGFTVTGGSGYAVNTSNERYASWTFQKAPKFFDVVTYTGNGIAGRTVNHNLGQVPGMMLVVGTTQNKGWNVYHRSLSNTQYLNLSSTDAAATNTALWNSTTPTASVFTVGSGDTNSNGTTYVAYLFAHDTTTDGLIQCGSYTGNGSTSGPTINLGWEPQYILVKRADSTGDWYVMDTMRGMTATSAVQTLYPNLSAQEYGPYDYLKISATGFQATTTYGQINGSGGTFIYMAIRRGPMRTPTDGTEVFKPYNTTSISNAGSTTSPIYNAGFVTDMLWSRWASAIGSFYTGNRLTGTEYMTTDTTNAAATASNVVWDSNVGAWSYSASYGTYNFQRAPGFFDVVCYAGTGAVQSINHSLGVAPEFVIVKDRTSTGPHWNVWCSGITNAQRLILNSSNQVMSATTAWNSTSPTATAFTVGTFNETNNAGDNFVTYLFASCPGVSKVGSYTGTGATQTISCGFTGGARFVLIKRTDSTGDWYVWDTARGMVAGTDPYLQLNTTAAEVNTNSVYTTTGGFQIVSTDAGINANGGSYIYLAIA